jgi:hypothetical protein
MGGDDVGRGATGVGREGVKVEVEGRNVEMARRRWGSGDEVGGTAKTTEDVYLRTRRHTAH